MTNFNWRETHHLYYGIGLIIISVFWGGCWLAIPGVIIAMDDIAQHFFGLDPSPLHQLYVKYLWPNPIIQKINVWLDNFFKKV